MNLDLSGLGDATLWVVTLIVLQFLLLVVALVSLWRTPSERLRHADRPIWLLVIVFLSFVGPLAFLTLGRRSGVVKDPETPASSDSAELLRELYGRRSS